MFRPLATFLCVLGLLAASAAAEEPGAEEAEALLDAPPASRVSDGELSFLPRLPDKPVHHHQNHVVIAATSLADGWVAIEQCHDALDAVPSSQIVFSRDRIRDIRVVAAEGIGEVWVEGHTVQLRQTQRGARLCLQAQSRALRHEADGSYVLRNGPFLRRFLDGYYPMRVSMRVTLEAPNLRYGDANVREQPGFRIWKAANEVFYDAQFEGRLTTELRFLSSEP